MQSYDVVIVGGGPGGLAAAMLLGYAGLRVKIFERQSRIGGRTSSFEAAGYRFDLGPTFFLYPRVLKDVFSSIGRDLHREIPMVKLDPQYRLVFGRDGVLNATGQIERMEAEIARFNSSDAANFRRYMSETRIKLETFRPILESPFSSVRDLLDPSVLRAAPWVQPWKSLDGDLRRYFSDPRVRLAFSFQSKYLGMSPFKCPSLFSILSFLEYEHGVFHPLGGCSAVSERMAEIATQLGVEIALETPVQSLKFEGRRVVGGVTREGEFSCRSMMINADFSHAMQHLVPDQLRKRWTDRKIEKKKFSCSTFMLYLGIEGLEQDLAHHTIYISEDYNGNLQDIESRHRLSADPSIYVQNASITDPGLAPAGNSTLYVLAPVSHQHRNIDWSRETAAFRAVVLRQLREKLGVADLEQRIRYERMITPADWETQYGIYRGATFNLAHNLGQMLHLRPNNRFEDLDGVYLVGGGTHPGSGLPVIYESARISSRLLLQDLGVTMPPPPAPSRETPAEEPAYASAF